MAQYISSQVKYELSLFCLFEKTISDTKKDHNLQTLEYLLKYHKKDWPEHKTISRNIRDLYWTLLHKTQNGNSIYNFLVALPPIVLQPIDYINQNNINDFLLDKCNKEHLHTSIFFERFMHFLREVPSNDFPSTSKIFYLDSINVSATFFPVFVGIINSLKKEKTGWESFKENIIDNARYFQEEILTSKPYHKFYEQEKWEKIISYWLDLFLPDELCLLCDTIDHIKKHAANSNFYPSIKVNLAIVTDYLPYLWFITKQQQTVFYNAIQHELKQRHFDPFSCSNYLVNNIERLFNHAIFIDQNCYSDFKAQYKNYSLSATIKQLKYETRSSPI